MPRIALIPVATGDGRLILKAVVPSRREYLRRLVRSLRRR